MPLNLTTALADLRNNPSRFLSRHPVLVVPTAHGQQNMYARAEQRQHATPAQHAMGQLSAALRLTAGTGF